MRAVLISSSVIYPSIEISDQVTEANKPTIAPIVVKTHSNIVFTVTDAIG